MKILSGSKEERLEAIENGASFPLASFFAFLIERNQGLLVAFLCGLAFVVCWHLYFYWQRKKN